MNVSIPLTKLVNKNLYRTQVLKILNIGEKTDDVNLSDDQPELLFCLEVEGKPQEGGFPPFYVSLNIHYKKFHNVIVDEVNPLYGQRRSLLAQIGSSNNQTMLSRKSLIAN